MNTFPQIFLYCDDTKVKIGGNRELENILSIIKKTILNTGRTI